MSLQIHRATIDNLPQILPLVQAYHAFEAINMTDAHRKQAVSNLLSNQSLGDIWHISLDNQSAGYLALTFGYSIEFGGKDAFIDEFYIRPQFRGQGLGTQALRFIKTATKSHNICALHLEVARDNQRAQRFYTQAQFQARQQYMLMSADL